MSRGYKYKYTVGDIYGSRLLLSIEKEGNRSVATTKCIYCGRIKRQRPDMVLNPKHNSCRCSVETHSRSTTRLYHTLGNMKYRCSNQHAQEYCNYGGKGVRVCDEWQTFEPFMKWAYDSGYNDQLSIDRIDSDGDYEPDNCRWITLSENVARANSGSQHRRADKGTYYGVSPDGVEYVFENAAQFSREHGLAAYSVRKAANKDGGGMYGGWTFGFVNDRHELSEPQSTIESRDVSRVHDRRNSGVEAPSTSNTGDDIVSVANGFCL